MGTFDPSMLMDLLKKQAGVSPPDELTGSNRYNVGPSSSNAVPDASPAAPPPPAPPSQPPAQVPQQQRLQGIKGYLSNILHGVGEGMKAHLGMETDAQQEERLYNQGLKDKKFELERQNLQSEIMQRAAQVKQMQSAVTLPNGMQVPFALAKPYIDAWGKQQAAATGKRFMVVPNVGMMDTQAEGGPKLIPGSSPTGVTVTPEIAAQYNMPQQLVGKSIPLGQFAQMERGGAMWAPTVSNTVETKELASGELVRIPKTSTSQKVGAAVPGAAPKAPVSLNTRGGVKVLLGPDGKPLQGKSAADTVYATDPKTGQQTFMSRSQVPPGHIPTKVTGEQVRKDQALSNRLSDVQRKVGDYAETFDQPIDAQDQQAIAYVLDNNIGAGISGHGLHVNILPQYIQSQLKARGMQALSDAGMKRLILFNQARESLSGYQQILTNSSRSSDKVLELQLEQLPPPLADKQFADMTTGQFQQNLDLAGQHMPIFPGSAETQQSIKTEQSKRRAQTAAIAANQAKGASIPQRPANVPANYIYNANGPRGAGWYKPKQ